MKKRTIIFSIVGVILFLFLWMVWGNVTVGLHEVTVSSPELPEAFSGYKIAQISDLHNEEFGHGNEKVLKLLREHEPDIIAITGDLIDSTRTDIEIAAEFIKKAVEIAPCYYVTGNHEAWVEEETYTALEEKLSLFGVNILRNREEVIEHSGAQISLIGLDDPSFSGAYMSAEEIGKLATGEYQILLAHRPEAFPIYAESKVNLVLSGHAHGGQFRIPFVGGLVAPDQGFFPAYDAGIYEKDGTTMVVSRGIGNSIIPIRVNNRPEVVLLELTRETK